MDAAGDVPRIDSPDGQTVTFYRVAGGKQTKMMERTLSRVRESGCGER